MSIQHHFGVYGVILSEGMILVVKKSRGPYTGYYDLPGGAPEAGETEDETLERELLEETGGHIDADLGGWYSFDLLVTTDSAGNPIQFRHSGKWKYIEVSGVNMDSNGKDVSAIQWKSIDELQLSPMISAPLKHVLIQMTNGNHC